MNKRMSYLLYYFIFSSIHLFIGAPYKFCNTEILMMPQSILLRLSTYARLVSYDAKEQISISAQTAEREQDELQRRWFSEAAVALSKRDYHAMIYHDDLQGKDYLQSHQSLLNCLKDKAPSKTTVFRWFKEFGFSSTSLDDDDRYGRPVTVCSVQNVLQE